MERLDSDFQRIYAQAVELANDLCEREYDDSYLDIYNIYSNNLTQIIQILQNMQSKPEDVISQTKNLLALHKKVENRLIHEKNNIAEKISNSMCREHIRQKYYTKSIKNALLNKKI